jgi:hypothetical protein
VDITAMSIGAYLLWQPDRRAERPDSKPMALRRNGSELATSGMTNRHVAAAC